MARNSAQIDSARREALFELTRVFRAMALRIAIVSLLLAFGAQPAAARPGDLDTTFGDDGWLLRPAPPDEIDAMGRAPDGGIVALGPHRSTGELVLTRLYADGSPDPFFGHDGAVTSSVAWGRAASPLLAIEADGKILVGGSRVGSSQQVFVIERYLPNGAADRSFGEGGHVELRLVPGSGAETLMALRPLADGRILLGGRASRDPFRGADWLVLARLAPDGTLDRDFGAEGVVALDLEERAYPAGADALALGPDGRFFVVGTSTRKGRYPARYASPVPVVARFSSDGSLDSSYGEEGLATLNNPDHEGFLTGAALLPDGKLVVLEEEIHAYEERDALVLHRLAARGRLDGGFGRRGEARLAIPRGESESLSFASHEVLRQPDGKLLVRAELLDCDDRGPGSSRPVLARFTPGGKPDREFGVGGLTRGQPGDQISDIYGGATRVASIGAMLIQPDERILVGGGSYIKTSSGYEEAYAIGRFQDSVAPAFTRLPASLSAALNGVVAPVTVRCLREAGPVCAGRLKLVGRYRKRGRKRSYVAGLRRFRMRPGDADAVTLRLRARARGRLARKRRLRLRGVLEMRDATGNSLIRSRRVLLARTPR
jgi:uncharacterized delta-60 repeat protein